MGKTDIGRKRKTNEDSLFWSEEASLGIVADGMGGLAGGKLASSIAVDLLSQDIFGVLPTDEIDPEELADESKAQKREQERVQFAMERFVPLLEHWLIHLNNAIFEKGRRDPHLKKIGTTITVFFAKGDSAILAHVGDSRIYRWRDGKLGRITADHSWINERLAQGMAITSDQKKRYRHIITRAVGVSQTVRPEIKIHKLKPGDIFLLCTDGLTDMLKDSELEAILHNAHRRLDKAVDHMVNLANARGGRDNITILLASIEK